MKFFFKPKQKPSFFSSPFIPWLILGLVFFLSSGLVLKVFAERFGTSRTVSHQLVYSVPFYPQAPLGEWDDPRQEDGCEEASLLMAMDWVRGARLDWKAARDAIIALSEYEKKEYGYYRDTSVFDTTQLLLDYFYHRNFEYHQNVTAAMIISHIKNGHLVIVPINGQKLNNPHFRRPGPLEHMLVIIGYDFITHEFVTNDPGTKYGAGYRYPDSLLEDSIEDYRTGYREKIDIQAKTMIVIKPELSVMR